MSKYLLKWVIIGIILFICIQIMQYSYSSDIRLISAIGLSYGIGFICARCYILEKEFFDE